MPPRKAPAHGAISSHAESFVLMDTVMTIRVVGESAPRMARQAIAGAIETMRSVETTLSRFDENSALRRLCRTPGERTPVPPMLYHALRIALEVASLTDGAFDPSVGGRMERLGFNRNYLTGEEVRSDFLHDAYGSYRDITLFDDDGLEVRLERPLALDLGAVAKGLAVDLAAREIGAWDGFAIDAGGDVYVSGVDPNGGPWAVGIEDPRGQGALLQCLRLTDAAVCTSGSYRRQSPRQPQAHHLLDARGSGSARGLVSCSVVGPQAMMADVVSAAAFLLGADRATSFIEEVGLSGMCVTESREVLETSGWGALKNG